MKKATITIFFILIFLQIVLATNTTTDSFNIESYSTGISGDSSTTSTYNAQISTNTQGTGPGSSSSYNFESSTITMGNGSTSTSPATTTSTSSSSSSSSSSGVGISGVKTYNLDITTEGIESDYGEDDTLILTVGDQEFELQITSISKDSVFLYIVDEDKTITISDGHTKKADLNWDGVYDIFITPSNIEEDESITLFIKLYSIEEDIDIEEVEVLTDEEQEAIFEQEELDEGGRILTLIGIVVAVICLMVFIYYILRKKH
jgi:hypothetical protein